MRVILEGGPRDGDILVPIPLKFDWSQPLGETLTPTIRVGRYVYKGSARHFVQIWEYDE